MDSTALSERHPLSKASRYLPYTAQPNSFSSGNAAKPLPLALCLAAGFGIWLIGSPEGVTDRAWRLFAIFIAAILGIILQPLAPSPVALCALGVAMLTDTLSVQQALQAYSTAVPWLILMSFFIARGVVNTGLGSRMGYMSVSWAGSSTLRLAYALVTVELLIAPGVPSSAARSGGVISPMATSIAVGCDSRVGDGTERRLGAYLVFTCFQASCTSSAMFITAVTSNPLAIGLAKSLLGFEIAWGQWAWAALAPGLLATITMPAFLYCVFPPALKHAPEAPVRAREKLAEMGPMSQDEIIMLCTGVFTLVLWVHGHALGISTVTTAFLGFSILLCTGIVTWKQCLSEGTAWDTLVWFGALISLAFYLNELGLTPWAAGKLSAALEGMEPAWQTSYFVLMLLYFYVHYLFASTGAHVGALYTAFLKASLSLGVPPLLAALTLGFMSSLNGCITQYGIGSAPCYFATGYVSVGDWWR